MLRFLCITCGTQYPDSPQPPVSCPICEDERQYVPAGGRSWTEMAALGRDHEIVWEEEAEGLFSLRMRPHFGIGQRAFLIRHSDGNVLWDCLSLVDQATVERINGLGGLAHIAISHPHYYSSMLEWSDAFGGIPIHIHADDAQWVRRGGEAVDFWKGERLSLGAATMIRCGGHFEGASVLHCPWLAGGRGALLSGDTIQVVPDRRHVSFMYSYPNLIPLGAAEIGRIMDAVRPFAFDAVYGAFEGRTIARDGKAAVERSAERYLKAIGAGV
jgi:glyoxylase-like metal-dependent hydrolase (beta-lactamase superfamily II)